MSTSPRQKSIVITGCSSGFGRLIALHMAGLGWRVFATVRKEADGESLLAEATGKNCQDLITPVLCDITQAEQVAALAKTVSEATPQLDALVNNAGTAFAAPLELLSLDDIRAQFEINTVAHIGVIQALLPLLKAAHGTIINVSSVSGRIATPIVGAYAASKFALEALSDALRVELAPFGVRVVVIEPNSSGTNIWQTSAQRATEKLEEHRNGPYGRLLNTMEKMVARMDKSGFPPQLVANTVQTILTSPKPRARYPVPPSARWAIRLRQWLPDSFWDRQIRRMMRW